MGSLDMSSAKRQFLGLVEAVSSSQLPGFTIWLDTKLAEYKVNGSILPDDEEARNQQYPEWISRSLRQNLSFIFQGDNSLEVNNRSNPEDKITPRKAKRKLGLAEAEASAVSPKVPRYEVGFASEVDRPATVMTRPESDLAFRLETDYVDETTNSQVVTVKQEVTFDDEEGNDLHMTSVSQNVSRPLAAETPLPHLQQTFSLSTSRVAPSETDFTDTKNVSSIPFPGRESLVGSMTAFSDSKVEHSHSFQLDGTISNASAHSSAVRSETSSSVTSDAGPQASGLSSLSHQTSASSQDNAPGPPFLRSELSLVGAEPVVLSVSKFACPVCEKTFTRRNDVTRHVRKHTGSKPYECPYCDLTFSRTDGCYQHQRVSHNDLPVVFFQPQRASMKQNI